MSKELSPLEALERLYSYHDLIYKDEILYLLEKENLPKYKNIIEAALKALEIIKELFDFAIRFGTNQIMLTIINKRTNEYWELPIPKDKYDLLKEVLL